MSGKYRVWRVEHPQFTERISIRPAKTEAEIIDLFNVPKDAKVYPILDNRMKDGGKC